MNARSTLSEVQRAAGVAWFERRVADGAVATKPGWGLLELTDDAVDLAVKIPMRPGADSLAAASAVAFWELRAKD